MSAGESAEAGPDIEGLDLTNTANVLVLSERLDSDARVAYLEDLVTLQLANLLVVSFTDDPGRWLTDWERIGDPPGTSVLIEEVERESEERPGVERESEERPGVERESEEPGDLTGLGIAISERLTDWQRAESLLMFESLTVLLQHVELKRLFRFLHVLLNRVRATGSTAHYHLDPSAHDDRTVATLTSLFDAVVTYEDGNWQETTWP